MRTVGIVDAVAQHQGQGISAAVITTGLAERLKDLAASRFSIGIGIAEFGKNGRVGKITDVEPCCAKEGRLRDPLHGSRTAQDREHVAAEGDSVARRIDMAEPKLGFERRIIKGYDRFKLGGQIWDRSRRPKPDFTPSPGHRW